tara:strand:- start:701 stop:1108 length:408 start_codon:yes stop_codon:yes gene_type:complete
MHNLIININKDKIMPNQASQTLDFVARLLLVGVFIFAGIGKITSFSQTQSYMEAFNLPGFLIIPTIAVQLGAALCILVGFSTRNAALVLAAFCVTTALIFHLDFADRMQQIMFLKNLAIAGGFMVLAQYELLRSK